MEELQITVRNAFLITLLIPLVELSLYWQKDYVQAVEQEQSLEMAFSNIKLLKRICEEGRCSEIPYMKTILENTNKNGYYETFNFPNHDLAKQQLPQMRCDEVIQTDLLTKQIEESLKNSDVDIDCMKMGFCNVAEYSYKHYNMKNVSYVVLWRTYFQQDTVGIEDYSNNLKLVKLCFIFAVENAKLDEGFSFM